MLRARRGRATRVSCNTCSSYRVEMPLFAQPGLARGWQRIGHRNAHTCTARVPGRARAAQCNAPVALQELTHRDADAAAAPFAVALVAAVIPSARREDPSVLRAGDARSDTAALHDERPGRAASRRGCCACCRHAARRRDANSRARGPNQRYACAAGAPKRPPQQLRTLAAMTQLQAATCGQTARRQHRTPRVRAAAVQLRRLRSPSGARALSGPRSAQRLRS